VCNFGPLRGHPVAGGLRVLVLPSLRTSAGLTQLPEAKLLSLVAAVYDRNRGSNAHNDNSLGR